jgi:hypothetical protein
LKQILLSSPLVLEQARFAADNDDDEKQRSQ